MTRFIIVFNTMLSTVTMQSPADFMFFHKLKSNASVKYIVKVE